MDPLIQLRTRIGQRTLQLLSPPLASVILLAWATITPSLAGEFYDCRPTDVTVWVDHVHVKCDKATSSGIAFFAVPTASADPAHVARVLSVMLVARATGMKVEVEYDPSDTSGTDFGCLAHDCRPILSIGLPQ